MKAPLSPARSALEEVEVLHHLFRATLEAYAAKAETAFTRIRGVLERETRKRKRLDPGDCEKIVGQIRKLKITPEKGRRRDLKRIEKVLWKLDEFAEAESDGA